MTFKIADRVKETCSAPGTGTVTLLGAVSQFLSWSSQIGANNTAPYVIADTSGTNWEVGIGTVGSGGTTLARTTVLSSSNSGLIVNFSSGTQYVWCDLPASLSVLNGYTPTPSKFDSSQNVATTAFVQNALGNYASAYQTSGATTLTASQAGQLIVIGGGTTGITLPALSAVIGGATFNFIAQVPTTITAAGSDKLYTNWGGMVSSLTIGSSQTLQITNASGVWYITQGNILSELPSWTTSTRPSSPVAGQNGFNTTLGSAEYFTGSIWVAYGNLSSPSISYLVVGGGGGGGSEVPYVCNGGGGGGGGVLAGTASISAAATLTVTVGSGGAVDSNGGNSSISSVATAIGGGKGGGLGSVPPGGNGGSGGGGGAVGGSAGSGTSGQGNSGGTGGTGGNYIGGGGGGAAGPGDTGNATGNGGTGVSSSITGIANYYGGGGGGGGNSGVYGAGGLGGGGRGGTNVTNSAVAGSANTGGGGGGSGNNTSAAAPGGSGVVVISYPQIYRQATVTGTVVQTVVNGYYIYTFTGSGTITF